MYLCPRFASIHQPKLFQIMAILKSLYLKGASQKLGGVVLYQAKGRTLARELAPAISNPRTPSQMEQRVRMANVVSFYRANRGWMKLSFEDKKQSESDYNAFVSANLTNSRVALSKSEAAAGAAVVAPYKVTSGSLGSIEQQVLVSIIKTNLFLGNLAIDENTTIGQLSTALINNNNNMREGMQLSLVINLQTVDETTSIPYIVTRAYELLLSKTSAELVEDYIPGGILGNSGDSENCLYFNGSDLGYGAATFILSETTGGKTRVSTQSMIMFGVNAVYTQYTSELAWSNAIISYGVGTEDFLSANNAYTSNNVAVLNSIVSAVVGATTIAAGGEVDSPIAANSTITLNFARPIPEGVTQTIVMTNVTNNSDIPVTNTTVAADRRSISVTRSSAYSVSATSQIRITATIGEDVYTFNFYLVYRDDQN